MAYFQMCIQVAKSQPSNLTRCYTEAKGLLLSTDMILVKNRNKAVIAILLINNQESI